MKKTSMTTTQKRSEMKRILSKLEPKHLLIFNQMYSAQDLHKDVNLVVDEMRPKQLDWALAQCKNTYYQIFKILSEK